MFCSFETAPRIMRFFCRGRVVEWDQLEFETLLADMGKKRIEGPRAIISLDVFKVNNLVWNNRSRKANKARFKHHVVLVYRALS